MICISKSGVGKTTIASALALAEGGHPAHLITTITLRTWNRRRTAPRKPWRDAYRPGAGHGALLKVASVCPVSA